MLYRIIGVVLVKEGRRYLFSIIMEDKLGNFVELIRIISENGGNILSVN